MRIKMVFSGILMTILLLTACGSHQPASVIDPLVAAGEITKACMDDFKKDFPRNERIVKDGYYSCGKMYTLNVNYTVAEPKEALFGLIKWTTSVRQRYLIKLVLGANGFGALGEYNAIVFKAQNAPGALLEFLNENRLYTDLDCTIVKSEYIFNYMGFPEKEGRISNIHHSWMINKENAEKYVSPEEVRAKEKAEREAEKKALEFEQNMQLIALQMFITQNPFYHSKAEKLFIETWTAAIMKDEKTLESITPKFNKLSQNEQYEYKRRNSEYTKWMMSF